MTPPTEYGQRLKKKLDVVLSPSQGNRFRQWWFSPLWKNRRVRLEQAEELVSKMGTKTLQQKRANMNQDLPAERENWFNKANDQRLWITPPQLERTQCQFIAFDILRNTINSILHLVQFFGVQWPKLNFCQIFKSAPHAKMSLSKIF